MAEHFDLEAARRNAKNCYSLTLNQDLSNACDEITRLREVLYEIANRASNLLNDDAAEWLPSIYRISCEAVGENPTRILSLLEALRSNT